MGTGINRQTSARKRRTAERQRATLLYLAELFPEETRIEGRLSDVRDFLLGGKGPGRRASIPPTAFAYLRAKAVRDLTAVRPDKKPTRAQIAAKLNIDVRTLFEYDHRPAGASPDVRLTVAGPGFRIETG